MGTIHEKIKTYRMQLGMTQSELAKRAGYTDRSSIAKIESGVVDLPQSKIRVFANIFGVSPADLIERDCRDNDIIADITLRMQMDNQYKDVVCKLDRLDQQQLSAIGVILDAMIR